MRVQRPDHARLTRLAAVHAAAFAPDGRGWSAAEIGALAASGRLFATADDAAFALISLAADEAELLTIAVDPARRREGLGAALLREAMAGAPGAARMLLDVAEDNRAARALYENAGFRETGRRKRYYGRGSDRVDAILYAAPLSPSSRAAS